MLAALTRLAFRKGVLGGSRAWVAVGGAAVALRLLKRMAARQPEVVYCETLEPGQTLLVSHRDRTFTDLDA